MRVIQFTPPADEKIKSGEKTMTARCWRQKPPLVGEIVRAQTGRRKDTAFAWLKIIDVFEWSGYDDDPLLTDGIAKKEGFVSKMQFMDTYHALNGENIFDLDRKHYFIEFEVEELI